MGVTQVYTLGDSVGFELNNGSVMVIKHSDVNEGLLGLLYNLVDELGRVPTFKDVLNHPKMPHPNTYSFYFGSFAKAAEVIEGKIRFRKWQETNASTKSEKGEKTMPKKSLTDNQILELLRDRVTRLGRLPSQKEINGDPELPSYPTIRQRFGSKKQLEMRLEEFSQAELPTNNPQPKTWPEKSTSTEDVKQAMDSIMEVLMNPETTSDAQAAASHDELKKPDPVSGDETIVPEPNKMTIALGDTDGVKTINLVITLKISLSR